MSNPVARRYALALYEEAQQAGSAQAVDADVVLVGETLAGSRELRALFASPIVAREKKEAVLGRLFEGRVDALTLRFLRLLVEKQREELVPAIVEAYRALSDTREGVVEAHVRSAQPLTDDERAALQRALTGRTGRAVRLVADVDPALIGGLVVRVGDRVYDRSLRHQLEQLREQLAERAALAPGAPSAN